MILKFCQSIELPEDMLLMELVYSGLLRVSFVIFLVAIVALGLKYCLAHDIAMLREA